MSRVVMFVLGDARFDARVRREAETLQAAGHEVTIVGRPSDPWSRAREHGAVGTVEIIRIPVPGRLRGLLPGAAASSRAPRRSALAVPRTWHAPEGPTRVGNRSRSPAAVARSLAALPRSVGSGLAWIVRLRLGAFAWATAAAVAAPDADVWHGHDLPGLVAASEARRRRGGRVVFDAHEIYVEAGGSAMRPRWAKALVRRREAALARRADIVVTVNDAVARHLRETLGVRRVVVVHNCPPLPAALPDVSPLRAAASIAPEVPVALYHGSLVPWRGIETLAAALLEPGIEAVHAVILGRGSLAAELRSLAGESRFGGRLHVLDPVDPSVLEAWIAGADVGVMAIAPSTLNHRLSTPNKLFECLAAGVPVVASDFPGIRAIVCDDPGGPLGRLCDPMSVASVAEAIREVIGLPAVEREQLRARCLRAARERWNWGVESLKLVELYASLGAAS